MKSAISKSKSLIFISMILIIVSLSSCFPMNRELRVEKGVLDLSSIGSLDETVIDIRGDFAFFWNEFATVDNLPQYAVSKAETFLFVPAYWKPYERGYGIYSLKIIFPEDAPEYFGIKMTNVLENYSLYANGTLVHQIGLPGITKEGSIRESAPALISIPTEAEVDLMFQMSLFQN